MLVDIIRNWLRFRHDKKGASSVIGVILMVGIVVILGAAVGTAVFGIGVDSWVSLARDILEMDDSVKDPGA